jgi:UDP-3-O-[3-hydroxymyristoyl] N-acetylglucosamine deacetylase/3-hydroxyacyl-[acyl-carrier-protein] dehydratase
MDKQKTICGSFSFEGVGLHTGEKTKIEVIPALENTGIVFLRKDIFAPIIKADIYSIVNPDQFSRRTCIGSAGVYVQTIEHLMAAFHLLGVDNAQVNIWGQEVPGLDGSAKPFVEKIKAVGLTVQNAPRTYLTIKEPLWVEEGSSSIVVLPYPSLRVAYSIKYDNPVINSGYVDLSFSQDNQTNIYEARTFCLEEEVKPLLDMGLGKGSNYENTLVVAKTGVIKNTLRFPDEFVKHKALDLIGDLYLAGHIRGYIIAIKSGHALTLKLLERLRHYKEKSISAGIPAANNFSAGQAQLTIIDIMKILPHRFPFLLVDKIIELEKGKRAIGIKNVTMNEHFFQGHFPGHPVMPGVLIVEAMAQVGGVVMLACPEHRGKLAYFLSIQQAKFRKTVEPGDQLVIETIVGKVKTKTGTVTAKAMVADKVVAEAELMFAFVESSN